MKTQDHFPRQCVEAVSRPQLTALCNTLGESGVVIDFAGTKDQAEALTRMASALHFPSFFGGNLDALFDCLTDTPSDVKCGLVLVLIGLNQIPTKGDAAKEAILDVLRDAAEEHREHDGIFRVFYAD